MAAVWRELKTLDALWHAAGVLADGLLPNQNAETLARVYAPKVNGACTLQMLTTPAPLGSSTLFWSVASMLGGAAQANYSAAN